MFSRYFSILFAFFGVVQTQHKINKKHFLLKLFCRSICLLLAVVVVFIIVCDEMQRVKMIFDITKYIVNVVEIFES